ncbi:hypothetical protein QE417_004037 [Mucilaginibacter terrae]|uniref:Uncharacterized protein n=1 Tax=Mucilaginibacter terrae TaxID=1955052 RepID=A0ABU3GZ70_9SPHI|nr:hypothetical protein [Mucilaginibacter terrae]
MQLRLFCTVKKSAGIQRTRPGAARAREGIAVDSPPEADTFVAMTK